MTLRFVLATANPDKAQEIVAVLRDSGAPITLEPRDPSLPDVEETGDTLEENARIKAVALAQHTGCGAIADDTGLEVGSLGGEPGVRAARFAGPHATYADNVGMLLARMEGFPAARRGARFRTVCMAVFPDGSCRSGEGVLEGRIAESARGENGFGYDPVFEPRGQGRTLAEMSAAEKNAISHRAKAARDLARQLRGSVSER